MDQQLVIKLNGNDSNAKPIGLVESPPMLYINFKELHKDVSFSEKAISSETEPYFYGVFKWDYAPTNVPHTKNVKSLGLIKKENGVWSPAFELIDATPEEISERIQVKSEEIRLIRNKKLKLSDFCEIERLGMNAEMQLKFDEYRKILRDIPNQPEFPFETVFPIRPDKI
jgi:hypothetical protein